MKTDDLIRMLSVDDTPVAPLLRTLALWFAPAFVTTLAAVWLILGFRIDLMHSLTNPLSAARYVLAASLGVMSVRLALGLARPEASLRLWPLGALFVAAIALYVWAYVTTPIDARQMATVGKTVNVCLISIPLLAILPVAAIFATLRRGATRLPYVSSALAGLGGSGAAAAAYALYCREDSPLFYLTWYGLAILIVTAAASLIGPRLLRW